MRKRISFVVVTVVLLVFTLFAAANICLADAAGNYQRGMDLQNADRVDDAIQALSLAIKEDPTGQPAAYYYLASCYCKQNNLVAAIDTLKSGISWVSSTADRLMLKDLKSLLATYTKESGDYRTAETMFESLISEYLANAAPLMYELALCQYNLGNVADAIATAKGLCINNPIIY